MTAYVALLRSVKLFEQQLEVFWRMVQVALSTRRNRLHKMISTFSEHLPWTKNPERTHEVMATILNILQENPVMDAEEILASCVSNLWVQISNSMYNNTKKATTCVEPVKKVFVWCKDAEWFDPNDNSKPTLNYKLLIYILEGFVQTHKDVKEILEPFFDMCYELWDSTDADIVDHIDTIMTLIDGKLIAVLGGYKTMKRLINMFLTGQDSYAICRFSQAYPKCPEAFNEKLEEICGQMEFLEESLINSVLGFLQIVASEDPQAFTPLVVQKMVDTLSIEGTHHTGFLAMVPLSGKRPELFEPHEEAIITSIYRVDHMMLYAQGGYVLANMVKPQGDEERARRYMKIFVEVMELGTTFAGLCLIINMRKVGHMYPAALADYRDLLEAKKSEPMIGDHCVQALNILDGLTLSGVAEDIGQAQAGITELDERVTDTDAGVAGILGDLNMNQLIAAALMEETKEQEERLKEVEDVVEEVVENVEEIDRKTLSHAPVWSGDVAKLMNVSSANDWRLLAERLGYSQEDIVNWSTKQNPCLTMLDAWFASNKTREATFAVLSNLEEINREDAYLIVENALKHAEGVVVDEDAEYTEPPLVFLSYQWAIQDQVKLLKQHLEMAGYSVWMDIGQMGGGDKLFEKIDQGIREAKVVIACITEKYAKSPNCNREINLSVNLKKPMIPLLMEQMSWPPKGSMGPIFGESLFIRFFSRQGETANENQFWPTDKFQEMLMQIRYNAAPKEDLIQESYKNWMTQPTWTNESSASKQSDTSQTHKEGDPVDIFISYQWDMQTQIKSLYTQLTDAGYTCWLNLLQLKGGDSLHEKVDKGLRDCRMVLVCMTSKYGSCNNCRSEVSLATSLNKPILVSLLEKMTWPAENTTGRLLKDAPSLDLSSMIKDVENMWKTPVGETLQAKLRDILKKPSKTTEGKDKKAKGNENPSKIAVLSDNRDPREQNELSKNISDPSQRISLNQEEQNDSPPKKRAHKSALCLLL